MPPRPASMRSRSMRAMTISSSCSCVNSTNKRTDAYGGSHEKCARLLLEVATAVAEVCGGERVGIRLSPLSSVNDAALDSDLATTYGYVVAPGGLEPVGADSGAGRGLPIAHRARSNRQYG